MITRRSFLKNTGLSIATIPFLSSLFTSSLFANDTTTGYKAVVVLQLDGGNDAFNTFVPIDSTYDNYKNARKSLAIKKDVNLFNGDFTNNNYFKVSSENPYKASAPDGWSEFIPDDDLEASYRKGSYHIVDKNDNTKAMGINSMMPEVADLFKKEKLSIISNTGVLVKPTTKSNYENKQDLPLFLFAHDHQRRAIATANPQSIINTGWLGRVADDFGTINGDIGLNISYDGMNKIVVGKNTSPFIIKSSPAKFKDNDIQDFLIDVKDSLTEEDIFRDYYKQLQKKSVKLSKAFSASWPDDTIFDGVKNCYDEDIFTTPNPANKLNLDIHTLDSKIFTSLKSVAKMLKVSKEDFGFKRQTFFVKYGGFDFHSGQIKDHTIKLRGLSLVLSDFYKALEKLGLQNDVILVTSSDFGRTLLGNGDGTDHGWGGHQMVMGDSINGGKILGNLITDLDLQNSPNLVTKKGRLLPSTSSEQIFAPIMEWFGVDNETSMLKLFPNLKNFATDNNDYKSAYLKEMI